MPNPPLSRRVILYALSPVLLSLSACGGDGGGGDIQEPKPVTTVTVTAPAATIEVGQTVQLAATARDEDGTVVEGRTFEWTTSDDAVASVSPTGLVSGIAVGQVEIRATTEAVTGSVAITVVPAPPVDSVTPGLQEIATGLKFPTFLTAPSGDLRLFVLEKAGAIRVIKGGALLATPFLDLTTKVLSAGGEQGLLGLVFYPDYGTSGRFLVHYTDLSGASRLSLFRVSADADRADPTESVLLTVTRPGHAHNGGQILFGPDGFLYIGLGDGDDSDGGRGQSLSDLLGSILRIDVSSGTSYTVPPDNPFVGTAGARPEVWAYGFRNPWSFSFDRATGDLYIGDVGESNWEEVNYASAGAGAGRGTNYGWSEMEGLHCFRTAGCDQTGLTPPVVEYAHTEGCAVVGGHVYRGTSIPPIEGHFFYADYCAGWVRSFRMAGGVLADETDWPALEPGGQITSFGEDATGELYLLTRQGRVFKIVPVFTD